MTLRERLAEAQTVAQRQNDALAAATLRLALTAIRDRERAHSQRGAAPRNLSDAEIRELLSQMVARRRHNAESLAQQDESQRAEQETREANILAQFLPTELSEAALQEAVEAAIEHVGARDIRDMRRAMDYLRQHYRGRMDFSRACGLLKQRLAD